MERKANAPEMRNAIYLTIAGLATGTFLVFGLPSSSYIPRITEQGKQVKIAKTYSPLSYLELTIEKEKPTRIAQKSLLTDNLLLEFDLTPQGKVERMTEDSSLWGKPNMRTSSPKMNPRVNWAGVNHTAQRYLAHFEKR